MISYLEKINMLTMYYDQTCTVCRTEAQHLQAKYPHILNILPVDEAEAELAKHNISKQDAMTYLCIQDANGKLYTGMDAVRTLYRLVGLKFAFVLYLPVIKQLSDWLYPIFARNRNAVPDWVTKLVFGQVADNKCNDGQCQLPNADTKTPKS